MTIRNQEADKMEVPARLKALPPYLFAEIDRVKHELTAQGKDVIDLGVGDPDLPTPDFVVEAMCRALKNPANHHYALNRGMPELRQAISDWYGRRFGVSLDPETEVLPLLGSKEGIAHAPLAFINPGDQALVPEPGYPPYRSGTIFAGGEPYPLPLLAENDFLPDFESVPEKILARAKLLFLNYPNNPTAACADNRFFEKAVSFASEHGLLVCHDAAYTEIAFDGEKPPSFLQTAGAKDTGIEFHSLSKTMNMTGWRVGFACGRSDAVRLLAKVKSNIDSGIFQPVQLAAIAALSRGDETARELSRIYQKRRDIVVNGLRSLGWKVSVPKAAFYMWLPVPPGQTSETFCLTLLKEANVVVIPGNGFGPSGEGYFRISLTMPEARLAEAIARIKKVG